MDNSIKDKIRLFRQRFAGRLDVYGTYNLQNGRARQIKAPVTDLVIWDHIRGRQPYGVYLLIKDHIRALAVDFDNNDLGVAIEFQRLSNHYGLQAYIERSKSKGYHVWIFFDVLGVSALKARTFARHVLSEIGHPETEIFPKQDRIDNRTQYGNFLNLPLFGLSAANNKTVFLNPYNAFHPYSDQWDFLSSVETVKETALDTFFEINSLAFVDKQEPYSNAYKKHYKQKHTFGLPPCAQTMLAEGVKEYQRVACFRIAIHLKKAGIPYDIAIAVLQAWATKNRPINNKRIITKTEIFHQTKCAYSRKYGCGCDEPAVVPFCDSDCPLKSRANKTVKSNK